MELETALDADVKSWLSFATQKIDELTLLAESLTEGKGFVAKELRASAEAVQSRASSLKVHEPQLVFRAR